MNANQCAICGEARPNGTETHHVVPERYGGSDNPENLVRLCASCHAAVEKIWDDAFYERVGLDPIEKLNVQAGIDGIELDEQQSADKQLPEHSKHVNYNSYHPQHDELVETWLLEESAVSADKIEELSHGEIYELDNDDPLKTWIHYDREPELIHCGYCNHAFLPWQHAKAARHLRIRHAVEDPYEESGHAEAYYDMGKITEESQ